MRIIRAKIGDVDAIYELGINVPEFKVGDNASCFWPKEVLLNLIKSKKDIFLVAKDKDKIIGFCIVAVHLPTLKATIENRFVLPEYRGKGVASQMNKVSEEILVKKGIKYICAFVEDDNIASAKMLENQGFEKGKLYYWYMKER